jgi:hypothetical protein
VLLLLGTTSLLNAAETEFTYSARGQTIYTTDVFRSGGSGAQDDVITTIGLLANFSSRTPRSETLFNYSPEYLNYATFDDLDDMNHRLQGSWGMTPGPRSSVGVRLVFARITQQSGFRDLADLGATQSVPVVQTTQRKTLMVEPSHQIDINRRWSMQTTAAYRSQSFSSPNLFDSTTAGLSYASDVLVQGNRRLGGVIRYGENNYEQSGTGTAAGTVRDRVVNLEAYWSQDNGEIFNWRIAGGAFRVVGATRPQSTEPSFRLSAAWQFYRTGLQAGYNNSFSATSGAGGTLRSESADINFTQLWGRAFTLSAFVSYLRLETLSNDLQKASLDGNSVGFGAAYSWQNRWGLAFRARRLQQEQSAGRRLDYSEASLGVTFTPD